MKLKLVAAISALASVVSRHRPDRWRQRFCDCYKDVRKIRPRSEKRELAEFTRQEA
jgi:hypothetical protein